jgi:cysteine-rich repeat protein
MRLRTLSIGSSILALCLVQSTRADDLGVTGRKLVIVDKLATSGNAKTVFVAFDPAVTKGTGTSLDTIALEFFVGYQGEGGPASGSFSVPAGASDGTTGWTVNKDTVAKFVNKEAPSGDTGVKVSTIKPGTSLKVVGKTLGDVPIDLIDGGAPGSEVCVAVIVTNGGDVTRMCTRFPVDSVKFSSVAKDTGRKLVARNGLPDDGCVVCGAGLPTTTTSSTSTSTSSSTSTSTSSTTTTSTSSTVTTSTSMSSMTTTSTTTSTIIPPGCGNGTLNAGETCDDGNNLDNDTCPADCFIASCTPDTGSARVVTVAFDAPAGVNVAGLTLFLNYPEQKVFLPPAGPNVSLGSPSLVRLYPTSQVTLLAADLGTAGVDSGYAVRALMGSLNPVPHGPIFQLTFQDCLGAAVPLPGEFNCTVLSATDPGSNPLANVTCYATLP